MFKKLKSIKGVALETAMIFMIIVFGFSTILYVTNVKESSRDKHVNDWYDLSIAVQNIGEEYVMMVKNDVPIPSDWATLKEQELFTYSVRGEYSFNVFTSSDEEKGTLSIGISKDDDPQIYYVNPFGDIPGVSMSPLYLIIFNVKIENKQITRWYFNNPVNDLLYKKKINEEIN